MKFSTVLFSIIIFVYSFHFARTIYGVNLLLIKGTSLAYLNQLNVSWNDTTSLLKSSNCNNLKKSLVYAYGWRDNSSSISVNTTIAAYFTRRDDYNIFVLDWYNYSNQNYLAAVASIDGVSEYVAVNLINMKIVGFNLEKFHFVGHSLGSHLCGYIGRKLQQKANFTVTRITGLDPAGPLFFPNIVLNPLKALSATDADFVDVIHTNSRQAGTGISIGDADFFPNGGQFQPGCPTLNLFNLINSVKEFCNHERAWIYFAESVTYTRDDKKFRSLKCKDYKLYLQNSCTGAPLFNYMGYYADKNASGNFYLTTNNNKPYSK